MQVRHALKVIDDRPIQIFIAKLDENPAGWAFPVQRVRSVLKPLQARTLRGTTARVGHSCNWIQLFHSPETTERRIPPLSNPKNARLG